MREVGGRQDGRAAGTTCSGSSNVVQRLTSPAAEPRPPYMQVYPVLHLHHQQANTTTNTHGKRGTDKESRASLRLLRLPSAMVAVVVTMYGVVCSAVPVRSISHSTAPPLP